MTESSKSNCQYSIIISYRDRKDHLSTLLPRLKEIFDGKQYEIIIAEQNDSDKFQKNSLYNIAVANSIGSILVFHDVDYYPSEDVDYFTENDTPLYPVRQVVFLDAEGNLKEDSKIPGGYRNFKYDVGDHSGGVFVLTRDLFYKVNGLNPYYKGWGKEDDDTRDRIRLLGYKWKRNEKGLFYALDHLDNKPKDNDQDFINNHILLNNLNSNFKLGYNSVSANVEHFEIENNIKWLKINKFVYESIN